MLIVVFKGCDQADPSKWAVWLRHGQLVPSQSLGDVSLSYFDWEKRATFPQKNIAPHHPPNHTLLVMHLIFMTEEVGVIQPNHRVWAIIPTPPLNQLI